MIFWLQRDKINNMNRISPVFRSRIANATTRLLLTAWLLRHCRFTKEKHHFCWVLPFSALPVEAGGAAWGAVVAASPAEPSPSPLYIYDFLSAAHAIWMSLAEAAAVVFLDHNLLSVLYERDGWCHCWFGLAAVGDCSLNPFHFLWIEPGWKKSRYSL